MVEFGGRVGMCMWESGSLECQDTKGCECHEVVVCGTPSPVEPLVGFIGYIGVFYSILGSTPLGQRQHVTIATICCFVATADKLRGIPFSQVHWHQRSHIRLALLATCLLSTTVS